MSTKQIAALEADETSQKRAQAEQFAFDVNGPRTHRNYQRESRQSR